MDSFIKNLARGAGAILRDGFRKKIKVNEKAAFWDVVTQYDLAAEEFIVSRIRKRYPRHGIVAEESGAQGNRKNFWIIDPLDGTRHFSRGLPQFTTCIAFVSGGKLRHSAIYDPMLDEMFSASAGRGAYFNGQRIRVAQTRDLPACVVSMYFDVGLLGGAVVQEIYRRYVRNRMWSIKTGSGAQCMAYVAAGRTDGLVMIGGGGPWDRAPGGLILKEAGAKVTNLKGRPFRWNSRELVAANPVLHEKIMKAFELDKLKI